jgi:uncharacterized protein (TIGR02118 family)
MIRLNYFMRKPENMFLEDFQQHWLDKHAALVVKNTPALRIRRYVQAHTLADDADGELMCQMYGATAQPYDGVAEFWWKNRQDLAEALQTPEGQQAAAELLEDERGFVDFSKSLLYFCVEISQINPPGRIVAREDNMLIKGYYVGHIRPGLSVKDIQFHWRTCHGALARQYEQFIPYRCYLQLHGFEDPVADQWRITRDGMKVIATASYVISKYGVVSLSEGLWVEGKDLASM